MKTNAVLVNDIYEKSVAIHKDYGLGTADVHYTQAGYKKLSELIISFLERELK